MRKSILKNYKIIALAFSALIFFASCAINNPSSSEEYKTSSSESEKTEGVDNEDEVIENNNTVVDENNESMEKDENSEDASFEINSGSNTDNNKNHSSTSKNNENNISDKTQIDEIPQKHTSAGSDSVNIISNRDPKLKTQWDIADSVVEAGQTYYNDYFSKSKVITKNGYIYNLSRNRLVDTYYLVEEGYLDNKYVNSNCQVLLLLGSDVKNLDGVTLSGVDSGLTVFSALKIPNEDKYIISSSYGGGEISSADYNSLMVKYNQNHGSISRLYPDSYEYNRIVSFINMHEGKYEQYFVRNIRLDGKYAIATLSPASDSGLIRQYILKQSNGIWEVVYAGLEKEPRLEVAVNKQLPDFNLSLLPQWSVYDFKNSINIHKNDVLILMSQRGLITGSNDVEYICGASNYYYIVLKNQVKYLARYNTTTWEYIQVASNYDAEEKLNGYGNNMPLFIIWDK